jgi:AcrR family transcriptional regulator
MTQQATTTAAATLSSELPAWQQARRLRIIKAANAALKEQEYEQIQIRDVAHGAGVALGTLYRYFSSKEHLYAAVLLDWAAPAYASSGSDLSEHQIRAKMNAVISSFERRPHFFKVHVILQSSADPNAKALLSQFFDVCHLGRRLRTAGPRGRQRCGHHAVVDHQHPSHDGHLPRRVDG